MSQKILRADLAKEDKVVITFNSARTQNGGGVDHIIEKDAKEIIYMRPHQDLLDAFSKFVPHLLFKIGIAEIDTFDDAFFDKFQFKGDARFDNVVVTGVLFVGKESDSIKIVGQIANENGEVTSLVSPALKLGEENQEFYGLAARAKKDADAWLKEVQLYLRGKYAPDYQLKIDLQVAS